MTNSIEKIPFPNLQQTFPLKSSYFCLKNFLQTWSAGLQCFLDSDDDDDDDLKNGDDPKKMDDLEKDLEDST